MHNTRPLIISVSLSCFIHLLLVGMATVLLLQNGTLSKHQAFKLAVRLMPQSAPNKAVQSKELAPTPIEKPTIKKKSAPDVHAKENGRRTNTNREPATTTRLPNSDTKKVISSNQNDHTTQPPIAGIGLPRSFGGGFGFAQQPFRQSADPMTAQAYYRQMMAIETRNKQLQQLMMHLNELSDDWEHPTEPVNGKCWAQSSNEDALECDPIEIKDRMNGREIDVLAVLRNLRSSGMSAEGISVTYNDSRYLVSVLSARAH